MTSAAAVAAQISRVRDLLVFDEAGVRLVVACDSVGGIGPKPADTVTVDAARTGHFAARVPLLEVICAGAQPLVVANNLCVEMEPTGREMTEAVRAIAAGVGVPAANVTGSTEENVETRATGIGVTVIGRMREGRQPGGSLPGDVVSCLGFPRSAPADHLYVGHPDLVDVGELAAALATGLIHDAVPVGSKGLAWEAPQLARSAGLELRWEPDDPVPRERSGGPSSCVLVSCDRADLDRVRACFADTLPVAVVGTLAESAATRRP